MRTRTARENVKVKTNTVKETLVPRSLNTMAMIRGVSWALASCTATSNAEQTKTTNVNIDEAKVANTARAASGLTVDSQPIAWSILWSAGRPRWQPPCRARAGSRSKS